MIFSFFHFVDRIPIVNDNHVDIPDLHRLSTQFVMTTRYPDVADYGDAGEEGEYLDSCSPLVYRDRSDIDANYMRKLFGRLLSGSYREPYLFGMRIMKRACVLRLLNDVRNVLAREETLVDVVTPHEGQTRVFGDIHGDIHSLAEGVQLTGLPDENNILVFAGDCVDRGSWGVEVFIWLFALKLWRPNHVFLLRGNHETSGTTCRYGFEKECNQKLGVKHFNAFSAVFRELPCAALLRTLQNPQSSAGNLSVMPRRRRGRKTRPTPEAGPWYTRAPTLGERRILVCHGGLYRAWTTRTRHTLQLGTLSDLALAKRQIDDPYQCLIEDVLWSDPHLKAETELNNLRGAGILYGTGAVESYFKKNGVHGILRAHEGPDMRERRPEMNNMLEGASVDIELVDGFVATVFSSANYPLDKPRGNKAAFATFRGRAKNGGVQLLPEFTHYEKRFQPQNFELFYDPNNAERPATPRN